VSRLYFSSATAEAELAGPERHWLSHLACGPGKAAWDITRSNGLDRCRQIVPLIPEPEPGQYGANYLHQYLRDAEAAEAAYKQGWVSVREHAPYDHRPLEMLTSSLELRVATIQASDTEFVLAGVKLGAMNVLLNTALAAGADHIRLAAKLSGWEFCLIEGEHRAWAADLIDAGLRGGGFRTGLGDWEDMGWGRVAEFLRSDDGQPVVTHHSTGESFPDQSMSTWTAPPLPDDWAPSWANDAEGRAEWAAYEDKDDARAEALGEQWYDLPAADRWAGALEGLRLRRPWCALTPETLGTVYFGPAVTVYDLLSPDREDRVRRAVEQAGAADAEEAMS
jgi:hypothetical protein